MQIIIIIGFGNQFWSRSSDGLRGSAFCSILHPSVSGPQSFSVLKFGVSIFEFDVFVLMVGIFLIFKDPELVRDEATYCVEICTPSDFYNSHRPSLGVLW